MASTYYITQMAKCMWTRLSVCQSLKLLTSAVFFPYIDLGKPCNCGYTVL